MGKTEQQIRKEIMKVIEGFLISFIDEYLEQSTNTKTIVDCHNYVKDKAQKGKQAFVKTLTINYSKAEIENFKTIKNNWLASIDTQNDFIQFLKNNNINNLK